MSVLALSATALAAASPSLSGSFDGSATPATAMNPTWLATDESTGDVWVADADNNVVNHFDRTGAYLGQLDGANTPATTFGFDGLRDDVAVDNSGGPTQGYVYVVGAQNGGPGLLTAYDASGNLRWQMPSENSFDHLCGVGVDPSGNLWTADPNNGFQQRAVADGSPIGSAFQASLGECDLAFDRTGVAYFIDINGIIWQVSPSISGSPSPFDGGTRDVAADSTTSESYLETGSSSSFNIYDPSTAFETSFGTSGASYNGLAVDGAHGTIFTSRSDNSTVEIWDRGSGTPEPYVRPGAPSGVSDTGATLNARVNPAGDSTDCHFEYVDDTQFQNDGFASATSANCDQNSIAAGTSDVDVTATISGLTTGTTYHWRIVARNGTGTVNSSDNTFDAETPIVRHTLSVITVTGNGRVDDSRGAIVACTSSGGTCSGDLDEGTGDDLTPTPSTHWRFAGWTGCDNVTGDTCHVDMTSDRSVTARFTSIQHTVTVTKAGTGSGTVSSSPAGVSCGGTCAALFDEGSTVTLTATPAAGSTFDGWSGGGCSGTGTCRMTVNADTTVTARFTKIQHTVTVSKAGDGTVTSSPAGINCGATCAAAFDEGSTVTLTATPAAGSRFDGWSGGGCTGTGTCVVTVSAAASVTATFSAMGPPPPGIIHLDTKSATVKRGKASIKVSCTGDPGATCSQKLTFTAKVKRGKKKKTITVGTLTVSLRAGASATLSLKLSGSAKSALAKKPHRLTASVKLGSETGKVTLKQAVKKKRHKKKH